MSGTHSNGRPGDPAGPSVYHRTRKHSPAERAALPPVRTKPIVFKGSGPGPFGSWPWAEGEKPRTVVEHLKPSEEAQEALLDWELVSWARRHVVEVVWDYSGELSDDELSSDAEVIAIARAAGLEVMDDGPA